MRARSFGSLLDQKNGVAPGFDFVRLFLATAVVIWHSLYYTHAHEWSDGAWDSPLGPLINAVVPCFFALSGFLVTGSLVRVGDLRVFLTFRGLRIIPALLTEIFISAIILGPLVTELSLPAYLSDKEFYLYFANVIGFVQYELPGVFRHQIYDQVNGALWTVPGEMVCYLSLAALVVCGIGRKPKLMLATFAATTSALYLLTRYIGAFSTQSWIPLVLCFYAGSVIFHYRHYVIDSCLLALISIAAAYWVMYFRFGLYILLGPMLLAYATCWIGMRPLPHIKYLMDGDHSYGIYLYHCPIIQTLIWLFGPSAAWMFVFLLAYPITFAIAALSWRYIERPTLSLKRWIIKARPPDLKMPGYYRSPDQGRD
jgi:peptidoglycan/LPS O-acetylase OafA/YrhL